MYSTCLFCNQDLGRNEAVEHFPVGRRLAFDPARGRLWVVCRRCERWNLTPLEERWEAIEDAERLFRAARLRASTDNVGMARLPDGTELVRIGEPQRPEFAAWRYGDQFGRRRTRQIAVAAGGVAALGAIVAGGVVAGVAIGGFGGLISQAARIILKGPASTEVAVVPRGGDHAPLRVLRGHLAETTMDRGSDDALVLDVRHRGGRTRVEGREAERVAALLMRHVNRFGGTRDAVRSAVAEIETEGGSEAFLARMARIARVTTQPPRKVPREWNVFSKLPSAGLLGLPEPMRLALEMSLHEESERRAMAGELAELEAAWRQAEEIAAIADDLLLPPGVDEFVRREREKLGPRVRPDA